MRRKNNQKLTISLFVLLLLSIGIVYAYLTSNLSITGSTRIANNTWDIHFANLIVNPGSVEATTPAAIDQNDTTSISYAVKLNAPGDFYEFTVDIVNAGTLPGKVNVVTIDGISTYSNIVDYSITYTNGNQVQVGNLLNPGSTKNIKVRVFYEDDIDADDLPDEPIVLDLTFNLTYNQTKELETNASNLLQNLSSTNSCIKKYNGQVTDRVGVTEEATNVYFDRCTDKRNIIFGGYCWQTIRTTETGGLKLLYNGEPVDGKCESTRSDHKGIVQSNKTVQTISTSYLYGSSFTYDTINDTFMLVDTFTSTWSDSTYEDLLGKFTCKSLNNSCSTIYQINTYRSNEEAYLSYYTIANTNYAQIGASSYNANNSNIAMVGYMFNKIYTSNKLDSLVENVSVGDSYAYGDSYTDNGNGTYTINDPTIMNYDNFSSSISRKYVCKNPINDTCNDVWYTTNALSQYKRMYYYRSSDISKYANTFSYSNGLYTLTGESNMVWNLAKTNEYISAIGNHHYTCFNSSGVCDTISYVYYFAGTAHYMDISGGKNVYDALNDMLIDNDVNKYNSSIKGIVDAWYENNLSNKTNYLEDAIYCNERRIGSYNGWDPNGTCLTGNTDYSCTMRFKSYDLTDSLPCSNITDQFSMNNNLAKLKYPVALLGAEEAYRVGFIKTGSNWFLMTPSFFDYYYYGGVNIFEDDGGIKGTFLNIGMGVRPVVSLASSIVISSGSGSETDPWIIQE